MKPLSDEEIKRGKIAIPMLKTIIETLKPQMDSDLKGLLDQVEKIVDISQGLLAFYQPR